MVNAGFDGSGTHGITSRLLNRNDFDVTFEPKHLPDTIAISPFWKSINQSLSNLYRPSGSIRGVFRKVMNYCFLFGKPKVSE